jgi:uncharacterized protein YjbI with pentapeptide repeats
VGSVASVEVNGYGIGPGADLRGADLSGFSLIGDDADLLGAKLTALIGCIL